MEVAYVILIVSIFVVAVIAVLWVAYFLAREKINTLKKESKQIETDYFQVINELEIAKEKLNTLTGTIDAAVIFLNQERQVTALNKTAETLFKNTSETALAKNFIVLVRDYEMDTIVQKCIFTNHEQKGMIQSSDNKQFLELTATPLNSGAIVLVRDITNIRKLEKIRQDFIVNISHELRTPIASCKAIAETLQNGALSDKKVARDFLRRMHIEIDKLGQMVNELGELSRIESGELKLKLTPVNANNIIIKVAERLKTQADRAQITISLDMPPELPEVVADADKIEQVLINLVHNAIKFTPQNGNIVISSAVQDDRIIVSVSDTGIGIPEDDLPHIFERFYKVDKARSGGGTGLGLSIAKHIIQAHSGEIHVRSKEGNGSLFVFSLPLALSPVLNTNLNKI